MGAVYGAEWPDRYRVPEHLVDSGRYLLMYREAVARIGGGAGALTEEQKQELTAVMSRFEPDSALAWLAERGADPVAAELARH